jgi:hypothetical protein
MNKLILFIIKAINKATDKLNAWADKIEKRNSSNT